MDKEIVMSCPIPIEQYPIVTMAHGGGGTLMSSLIEKMFIPVLDNKYLEQRHDSSVMQLTHNKIAFSTDSYVIHPLFFPGGDIGSLAVHGTVNDLAMSGAEPLYLSTGLIIEEGFSMEELWKIICSIKSAADKANVKIVTGDTKVVDKGKGDGIYINTAGVGIIKHSLNINPMSIRENDVIIINGDIGRHGMCIMAEREGLKFETKIESDSAPLNRTVKKLIDEGVQIHCMRDLTRGGLSSALVELAETSGFNLLIDEKNIPVREDVSGACEILGFDPMYVANEGRFVIILPESEAGKSLKLMHHSEDSKDALIIGKVTSDKKGTVLKKSILGTNTIVTKLSGEQLPRIC